MVIGNGPIIAPHPWKRPQGSATSHSFAWERTFTFYQAGKSIQTIATESGIQFDTILSLLLDAFKFGCTIDLARLCDEVCSQNCGSVCVCNFCVPDGGEGAEDCSNTIQCHDSPCVEEFVEVFVTLFAPRQGQSVPVLPTISNGRLWTPQLGPTRQWPR